MDREPNWLAALVERKNKAVHVTESTLFPLSLSCLRGKSKQEKDWKVVLFARHSSHDCTGIYIINIV